MWSWGGIIPLFLNMITDNPDIKFLALQIIYHVPYRQLKEIEPVLCEILKKYIAEDVINAMLKDRENEEKKKQEYSKTLAHFVEETSKIVFGG